MNQRWLYILLITFASITTLNAQTTALFRDESQPLDARVNDLIQQLTLEEKVNQMMHTTAAIPRLGIPAYNWWSESLHGVARSGVATVFPQAIGLAATFDETLMFQISSAISDEARAMYNAATAKGYHKQYGGLTFWTPNINIFRDPRWGRGQETYGEDPWLTSRMGVAFVRGLQGTDPNHLKVAACAKHFAVHSGPEKLRHEFNAIASQKDLRETFLPAFKALVTEANVEAVMCAYNRTNGYPCCANNFLITDVLRKEWHFKGHVVSDCWAITDFYEGHKTVANKTEAAALAVKSGVNLDCGNEYPALVDAVHQHLIEEKAIDESLAILLRTRFRLGLFDASEKDPYARLTPDVINSPANRKLAREAALKSIVLLKNNGALPLKNDLGTYFVTGPNAADINSIIGNYYGTNPDLVTYLEGIADAITPGSQLQYRPGVLLDRDNINPIDWSSASAKESDATIVVLGINGLLEGEEGEAIASPSAGDRLDYNLPKNQIDYLRKLKDKNNKPVIAVITGGSPMNLAEVHDLADAVLLVWYSGEEGGNALADIIFGKVSPSGRLPITFPKSFDQLPPYENYGMSGRTYRYMKSEPMYPFGFGLGYSKFAYGALTLSSAVVKKGQPVSVETVVTNAGSVQADEVAELYVTDVAASVDVPAFALKGFKRITLKSGESMKVKFEISPEQLSIINENGAVVQEAGDFTISVGGSLPGDRGKVLGAAPVAQTKLTVK